MVAQGGVGAVEIVVMEVEREEGSAMVTGVIRTSVSPLAGEGLDEAFGLAIGLGAVRACEEMADVQLVAGSGKELGAISGAAVGEDTLNEDAVILVESDSLVEGGEHAGSFFIWKNGGESQA